MLYFAQLCQSCNNEKLNEWLKFSWTAEEMKLWISYLLLHTTLSWLKTIFLSGNVRGYIFFEFEINCACNNLWFLGKSCLTRWNSRGKMMALPKCSKKIGAHFLQAMMSGIKVLNCTHCSYSEAILDLSGKNFPFPRMQKFGLPIQNLPVVQNSISYSSKLQGGRKWECHCHDNLAGEVNDEGDAPKLHHLRKEFH